MLVVRNLDVFYGQLRAVKSLSFHVDEGEIVTIIGANGSGKTSTLRAISGIMVRTEGEIIFENERIDRYPAHLIVKMGISHVPEGRKLFSNLRVEDNLLLGAYPFLKDRDFAKIVEEKLETVYSIFPVLRERRDQLAGTLSGGEQQMLAIGRALMSRPRLLLLDEPSMGLAPVIVKEIFNIIVRLRDKFGLTVLLVEQNARKALEISDRGYVLETGSLVYSGTAEELRKSREIQRAYLGKEEFLD